MPYSFNIQVNTNAGTVAQIYKAFNQDLTRMSFAKKAFEAVAKDVRQYSLDRWTRHWAHKPTFRDVVSVGGNSAKLSMWPAHGKAATIFRWVDQGTEKKLKPQYSVTTAGVARVGKDGVMRPGFKLMVFRPVYKAATQPGSPDGLGGSHISGAPWSKTGDKVRAVLVNQGIRPRYIMVQAQVYGAKRAAIQLTRVLWEEMVRRGMAERGMDAVSRLEDAGVLPRNAV